MMRARMSQMMIMAALAAVALAGLVLATTDGADAAAGDGGYEDHAGLVPDTPVRGYPVILKSPEIIEVNPNCPGGCAAPRETAAVDMIGPYIVSGGTFQSIRLQDGTTISQPWLAVFDSRDKSLVCTDLDVDDEVLAIAPGPTPNTAIIGGRFDRVTGSDGVERVRNKVALVDLDDCSVDKSWIVTGLNGKVTELAVTGNRLFVAGDFTGVDGTSIDHIAEVSHDTAVLNTAFDPNFGGALGRAVVGMEASPDGTRLAIVHRATQIMGDDMRGTAIFDITNPGNITLTDHEMEPGTGVGDGDGKPYDYYNDIQDGAISPDFSTIIIVQGTATVSDYVTALPTVESFTFETWQHFMRDSSFGVAATNDIVYVTGHFCKIDEGPGATAIMAPNSGPSECTGTFFNGGAWRTQLAALDINTGTPLTWNPGNDAFVGGRAVTVVNRGLLVGFDGERTDDILTGTTAFFDFGAPADPREDMNCTATVNGASVDLAWDAVDGISSYVVRRNTKWVASPGNVTSYTDTPPSGTHTYFIRTTLDGVQFDTECSPTVTVDVPVQTCTATLNADDTITLSWDAIAGEDLYVVRRNGGYLATPGNTLTFTDDPRSGVYTYVIRSSKAGTTTNTTCSPEGITIDLPAQTCTATLNADDTITLSWDAIAGEDLYVVRRNGGYLATPGNTLTFTDDPGSGVYTYVIRSSKAGTTTNTTCSPEGITVAGEQQICTITFNGAGSVTLDWTAIDGEDTYVVRRNNGWLATVSQGGLSFTANDHTAGDSYVIRSRQTGGVTTDTTCS